MHRLNPLSVSGCRVFPERLLWPPVRRPRCPRSSGGNNRSVTAFASRMCPRSLHSQAGGASKGIVVSTELPVGMEGKVTPRTGGYTSQAGGGGGRGGCAYCPPPLGNCCPGSCQPPLSPDPSPEALPRSICPQTACPPRLAPHVSLFFLHRLPPELMSFHLSSDLGAIRSRPLLLVMRPPHPPARLPFRSSLPLLEL